MYTVTNVAGRTPASAAKGPQPTNALRAATVAPAWERALSGTPLLNLPLPIQTKLTVNEPSDAFEQEADHVADSVMRMPEPRLQRATCACGGEAGPDGECAACKAKRLGLQRRATPAITPHVAPPIVHQTLQSPGQPLDKSTRTFMESRFRMDFGRVRIHSDLQAAQSADAVNAAAYTVGNNVVFAPNKYAPTTDAGKSLLAHELAHVVQQGAGAAQAVLQRDIPDDQLPSTPDTTIRSDPNYIDNGIQRIEFFSAELAIIHYEGGAQLRLGLVPDLIQSPINGVDYRTLRRQHVQLIPEGTGRTRFIPHGTQIRAPGMTSAQVVQEFARTITYIHDPASHRIVPTEVNDITAPVLCEMLRRSEQEYVRNTDEIARGMVHFLHVMEVVLIIASLIPTAGESAAAAGARGTAGAAAVGVAGRAATLLRQLFLRLLRSGATEAVTVEGVGFGGIRVFMSEGRLMTVFRDSIVNVERVAGQGRLIHSAFEQAAIAAAREAGATSARVALGTIQNMRWATYLESLGYVRDVIEIVGPSSRSWSNVLVKVFPL